MASRFSKDEDPITGINITPFVDITLVLLIIFMVTSHLVVEKKGIPLNLPKASSSMALPLPKNITVMVDSKGHYSTSQKRRTLEEIAEDFRKKVSQKENFQVIIAADKDVSYARVIDLMDTLRNEGISDFSLQTEASR